MNLLHLDISFEHMYS